MCHLLWYQCPYNHNWANSRVVSRISSTWDHFVDILHLHCPLSLLLFCCADIHLPAYLHPPRYRIMSCGSLSFSNSPTHLHTFWTQKLSVFSCFFCLPSLFLVLSILLFLPSFLILLSPWLPQFAALKKRNNLSFIFSVTLSSSYLSFPPYCVLSIFSTLLFMCPSSHHLLSLPPHFAALLYLFFLLNNPVPST